MDSFDMPDSAFKADKRAVEAIEKRVRQLEEVVADLKEAADILLVMCTDIVKNMPPPPPFTKEDNHD